VSRLYPIVVFDLDGTLLDSLMTTFLALDHAAAPRLGRPLRLEDIVPMLRHTDAEILKMLLDEESLEAAMADYLDFYRSPAGRIEPFDGIEDLLRHLRSVPVPVAVVTNRGRLSLDVLLEQSGLADLLPVVVAADDGFGRKPEVEIVRHAAGRLGVGTAGGLMVGDGPDDVRCGRAAGMITVTTRWCGLIPMEQIEAARPDHLVESVGEFRGLMGL
jgi:HAD superfamily hydrolase (TIGR01549 family)